MTGRRITQVTTDRFGGVIALCDDNTLWCLDDNTGLWHRLSPIPQPIEESEEEGLRRIRAARNLVRGAAR
jgi:hypothetical protein